MWKIIENKSVRIGLMIVAGLIVIILIFSAGVAVGFRKARFSYQWGENYHRMFGGPPGGFMGGFQNNIEGRDLVGGHGVAGTVVKIDGQSLIVEGTDGVERSILLDGQTAIRAGREPLQAADLKADDRIVVIGEPNAAGEILAKIIRVFPKGELPPGSFPEFRQPNPAPLPPR